MGGMTYRHFKYNYRTAIVPQIETLDVDQPVVKSAALQRELDQDKSTLARALGYGRNHPQHHNYLHKKRAVAKTNNKASKAVIKAEPAALTNTSAVEVEREVITTTTTTVTTITTTTIRDIIRQSADEQNTSSVEAAYRRAIVSGLGYGSSHQYYYHYLAPKQQIPAS